MSFVYTVVHHILYLVEYTLVRKVLMGKLNLSKEHIVQYPFSLELQGITVFMIGNNRNHVSEEGERAKRIVQGQRKGVLMAAL